MPSRGISGVTGPNVAQRPLGHEKKTVYCVKNRLLRGEPVVRVRMATMLKSHCFPS